MSTERASRYRDKLSEYASAVGINRATGLGILLFLGFFNVLPMAAILVSSFTAQGYTLYDTFTLANYEFLQQSLEVIVNTVVYTVGSAGLTTVVAVAIAWVISRTNAPFRKLYFYGVFMTFFLPPVIWEQTWLRQFETRGIYPELLGIESLPVQSIPGMIVVQTVRMVAFGLILLVPLFASMDTSLEESSRMSGAGTVRTALKITIPTLAPGILTVFILSLIVTLGSFRVPLVIGLPEKIYVLSIAVYEAARISPIEYGVAMAMGVVLILLALPLLWLYRRFIQGASRFQVVSGSGFQSNPNDIGRWKYVASALVGVYFVLTSVVPIALMLYMSLLSTYQSPFGVELSAFTLASYAEVLQLPRTWSSLLNSLLVASVTATVSVLAGTAVSWVVQKSDVRYKSLIDYVAFAPLAIPAVALALGVSFLYLHVIPIEIYGTIIIIAAALFVRSLPTSLRVVDPAIVQIDDQLLESAHLSGAGRIRRFFTVTIPLVANSLSSLWVFQFTFLMFELSIVMMMYTSESFMVSAHLWNLYQSGEASQAAALGILLMLLLMVVMFLANKAGNWLSGDAGGV